MPHMCVVSVRCLPHFCGVQRLPHVCGVRHLLPQCVGIWCMPYTCRLQRQPHMCGVQMTPDLNTCWVHDACYTCVPLVYNVLHLLHVCSNYNVWLHMCGVQRLPHVCDVWWLINCGVLPASHLVCTEHLHTCAVSTIACHRHVLVLPVYSAWTMYGVNYQ